MAVTNLDTLFLVMGFISLIDEIQFMLISSRHICIRSIRQRSADFSCGLDKIQVTGVCLCVATLYCMFLPCCIMPRSFDDVCGLRDSNTFELYTLAIEIQLGPLPQTSVHVNPKSDLDSTSALQYLRDATETLTALLSHATN